MNPPDSNHWHHQSKAKMLLSRTSLHGGQSPSQQRARHACRPQLRVRRHRNSQRSGSQQGTVFSSRPQEQVLGTGARQAAGQGPAWHRSRQRCSPQASSLSQVLPQVGEGSSHAKSTNSACRQGTLPVSW